MNNKEEIRDIIRKNYSEVALKGSAGECCSGGCSCSGPQMDIVDIAIKIGYSESDFEDVPIEANMGLGCGNPIAIAPLKEGEVVLDLGSGGGFDCFLARKQVGETGFVIGVDMTPEMINLSLDKQQVFNEMYRILKTGGRISISDIVATAELPEHIKNSPASICSCVAGAEHVENIKTMLQNAGFTNIHLIPKDNSKEIIKSWVPGLEEFIASFIIEAKKGS